MMLGIVEWIARRLGVDVTGFEHLPAGRALLVANHAFGWDILFAMSAIRAKTGRPVWVMGEHVWWRISLVRKIARALATVDGTLCNLDHLLSDNELVPRGVVRFLVRTQRAARSLPSRAQLIRRHARNARPARAPPADAVARAAGKPWAEATWLFNLESLEGGRCRFISRFRSNFSRDLETQLAMTPTLIEPIGFAMDRRMLQGVKERAERKPAQLKRMVGTG